jgi:hypothetical protein
MRMFAASHDLIESLVVCDITVGAELEKSVTISLL